MFRRHDLLSLMEEDLPTVGSQKRLTYRTDQAEVVALWRLLNKKIFNGKLEMPIIEVVPRCRKYWGMCYGSYVPIKNRRSRCKIRMMDKWY